MDVIIIIEKSTTHLFAAKDCYITMFDDISQMNQLFIVQDS